MGNTLLVDRWAESKLKNQMGPNNTLHSVSCPTEHLGSKQGGSQL